MRPLAILLLLACFPLPAQDPGEDLYKRNCAPCHGPKGEGGKGPSLRLLSRGSDEASITSVIRDGIPGAAMPAYALAPNQLRPLVAWVRKLASSASAADSAAATRGETLVRGKGACLRCHTIHGEGGFIGPDLSRVGVSHGLEYLRVSLVDPEADIADRYGLFHWYVRIKDDFLWVRLTTRDGSAVEGARLNEDPFTIQIRDFEGGMHSFEKSQLAQIDKRRGKSPMPSFKEVFTATELDDVVAYLSSLRGRR